MKEKKLLIASTLILGILIATPILIYIWNFSEYNLSSDPSNWGTVGDYIGGIINPIISLASLIVLGYLTYLVSEQSNQKSKSLFIFQKRLDAYEDLTKHFKEINMLHKRISNTIILTRLQTSLELEQQLQYMEKRFQELMQITSTYLDFYNTLFSFSVRFGHLFEYDFDSKEYKELLNEVKLLSENYESIVGNIIERKDLNLSSETLLPNEKYKQLLVTVLNNIRDEVLPKNN